MLLRAFLLLAAAANVSTWSIGQGSGTSLASRANAHARAVPYLLAKKKSKSRKSKGESRTAAASSPPPRPPPSPIGTPPSNTANAQSEAPLDARLDDVLRNAGLAPSSDQLQQAARPSDPTDVLSRIPQKGQVLLEQFFGGGALVFGSAFLLSGIAVSVEAVCKVTGNALPTALDEVLVQYVEPALTPSILILFFFSISLGILKQLQLGNESAGVLYSEDDE